MRTPVPPSHPRGLSPAVRAALAVGLLAGFYLPALGIVATVVGTDIALAEQSGQPFGLGALKLYAGSALVVYPVLRVVFLSRRPADALPPAGLAVTPAQQPELWARVRRLAKLTGTRPPDAVVAMLDAQAGAGAESRGAVRR